MIHQRLAFAGLFLVVAGIVAQSGNADARWRCGGGGYGWGRYNQGYYNNGYSGYGDRYAYGYNGDGYAYSNWNGNNSWYAPTNQAAAPTNGYVVNRPNYGTVTPAQSQQMINQGPVNPAPNVAPAPPNAVPAASPLPASENGALPNPENSNGTIAKPPTAATTPATQGGVTDVDSGM